MTQRIKTPMSTIEINAQVEAIIARHSLHSLPKNSYGAGVLRLIPLAAAAPTVDALETMFDVVSSTFDGIYSGGIKADADALLYNVIMNHQAH